MSRLISRAHPEFDAGRLLVAVCPVSFTLVKQRLAVVQDGRPHWLLKVARSAAAVGSSYASTTATVFPLPAVVDPVNP